MLVSPSRSRAEVQKPYHGVRRGLVAALILSALLTSGRRGVSGGLQIQILAQNDLRAHCVQHRPECGQLLGIRITLEQEFV